MQLLPEVGVPPILHPPEGAEEESVAVERRAGKIRVINRSPDYRQDLHPGVRPGTDDERGVQVAVFGWNLTGKNQGKAEKQQQRQQKPASLEGVWFGRWMRGSSYT